MSQKSPHSEQAVARAKMGGLQPAKGNPLHPEGKTQDAVTSLTQLTWAPDVTFFSTVFCYPWGM